MYVIKSKWVSFLKCLCICFLLCPTEELYWICTCKRGWKNDCYPLSFLVANQVSKDFIASVELPSMASP